MTAATETAPPAAQDRRQAAESILSQLRVPLVAAPMLIVSNPEVVIAACRAGVLGSFPTANPRGEGELEQWLTRIESELDAARAAGEKPAPYVPNLIVHPSNVRLKEDLAAIAAHRPAAVITSVGSPAHVVPVLHEAGVQVWADVATVHHAKRAIDAGVDGLILLGAGAGGQTGWANPFAFVRAVRPLFDGVIAVAGGQSDGWAIWGAEAMGCDLGYMGTRFIATHEANAAEQYKNLIVDSELDDIHLTNAFSGLQTNMLRKSMLAQGLDPAQFGLGPMEFHMEQLAGAPRPGPGPKRFKDIWSAGHSVSGIGQVRAVADVVDQIAAEYQEARAASLARLT
jgi:nitronate monooxygenase